MVSVVKFDKKRHFASLLELHVMQGYKHLEQLTRDSIPKIGFVALTDDEIPIAMGFLRLVEGGYAQIDTFVSNPEIPGEIRHEALNEITNLLISKAK